MMKKLVLKGASIFAALLTLIAVTASASACWTWMYQPEEPKSLRS